MSREHIDISFIIPVYNGESCIERMLDSLAALPKDLAYEVIVVDDGSTDRTADILQKIGEQQSRLQVITQNNQGQSAARNAGLALANGTYVFFADADDAVLAEGVVRLFRRAADGNKDIVCGTYRRIEPGRVPFTACEGLPDGKVVRGNELFDALKTESVFGYLWNKLYRRSFLLEHGLVFDASIKVYMEDQLFNLKAFACGPEYYFQNDPVYEYHFEGESTTRKAEPDIAAKSVEMLKSYDAFLEEKGIREENQDLFVPLAMRMAAWAAFKNIRYEGAAHEKIKARLDEFAEEQSLRYMFERKESREYLKRIPSLLQRLLLGTVFRHLKKKTTGSLASLFVIGSPVMRAAAGKMVR